MGAMGERELEAYGRRMTRTWAMGSDARRPAPRWPVGDPRHVPLPESRPVATRGPKTREPRQPQVMPQRPKARYRARRLDVLRALEAGAQTVAEVTERTGSTPSVVGQVLGRLADCGYTERTGTLPSDGRPGRHRVSWAITPRGLQRLAAARDGVRWEGSNA